MKIRHDDHPPPWVRDALHHVPTRYAVDVQGCAIQYRSWGDSRCEKGIVEPDMAQRIRQ